MSIWLIILAAWIIGSLIVFFPSMSVLVLVEVLASIVILALDITSGSSISFTLISVAVFVLFSSIFYLGTALCGAMIAYGRLAESLRSDEDTERVLSSVNKLLTEREAAANTMMIVKVQRSGHLHAEENDNRPDGVNTNAPGSSPRFV